DDVGTVGMGSGLVSIVLYILNFVVGLALFVLGIVAAVRGRGRARVGGIVVAAAIPVSVALYWIVTIVMAVILVSTGVADGETGAITSTGYRITSGVHALHALVIVALLGLGAFFVHSTASKQLSASATPRLADAPALCGGPGRSACGGGGSGAEQERPLPHRDQRSPAAQGVHGTDLLRGAGLEGDLPARGVEHLHPLGAARVQRLLAHHLVEHHGGAGLERAPHRGARGGQREGPQVRAVGGVVAEQLPGLVGDDHGSAVDPDPGRERGGLRDALPARGAP